VTSATFSFDRTTRWKRGARSQASRGGCSVSIQLACTTSTVDTRRTCRSYAKNAIHAERIQNGKPSEPKTKIDRAPPLPHRDAYPEIDQITRYNNRVVAFSRTFSIENRTPGSFFRRYPAPAYYCTYHYASKWFDRTRIYDLLWKHR